MNIDKKLNEMRPKDTPLLVLGYIILGMFLLIPMSAQAQDNEVYINQSGNNFDLTILQAGYDNKIDFSVGGTNNVVDLLQQGNGGYIGYTSAWGSGLAWGGDLDGDYNNLNIVQTCNQGSSCGGDRFEFHIAGNSNDVDFYQGYKVDADGTLHDIDDYEYGGHFTQLDIHGDNNTFLGSQRSNNSGHEHSNTTNIYGNYNDVYTIQEGNQDKTLNLTINNSNNNIDMIQKGSATHSASVTLSGSYATTLYMLQQGGTAQSYTLSQSCATIGGCSVSVTQGN
jgi:hypothetical protein